MKKYLTLAAVMGAIAFLSVSTFAQAQAPAAAPAGGAAMAPAAAPAAGSAMPAASPAAVTYAKDRAECDTLASAPSTEGAAPSAADKEASIKKCLGAKGHSADEITAGEATKSPAPAMAPPAAMAPAAPTAPTAPAAPAAH